MDDEEGRGKRGRGRPKGGEAAQQQAKDKKVCVMRVMMCVQCVVQCV